MGWRRGEVMRGGLPHGPAGVSTAGLSTGGKSSAVRRALTGPTVSRRRRLSAIGPAA